MVAVPAFQKIPPKMTLILHLSDRRLDGGAASELALDLPDNAAPL